jgi:regulatory protein
MSADEAPPAPDAYKKALGLLVRREHSRRELKRKLGTKGADPVSTEAALDTLTGQGYQSDARFAEMLVRTRLNGGYGPMHIRAELGTHDIPVDTVNAVFAEAEPDWTAIAREALRRRYGALPALDRADMVKRAHFLQRRGFDAETIRAATSRGTDGTRNGGPVSLD